MKSKLDTYATMANEDHICCRFATEVLRQRAGRIEHVATLNKSQPIADRTTSVLSCKRNVEHPNLEYPI